MQTPATNLAANLFGVPANGPSTGLFVDDAAAGDLFSQLLGGFDTGAGANQQNLPGAFGDTASVTPQALLQAQLASSQNGATDVNALLQQSITPAQAKDLLANLDSGKFSEGDASLFQQLREQLQQLSEADDAQTVAELAANVANTLSQTQEIQSKAATTSGMQRALVWLGNALKKAEALASSREDATKQVTLVTDPNLQSLQASYFRPSTAEDTSKGGQQAQDDEKSKTKVEIIPVAQMILVPQWVAAIVPEKPAVKTEELPAVSLPSVGGDTHMNAADALASGRKDFDLAQMEAAKESVDHASSMRAETSDALHKDAAHTADKVNDALFNPSAAAGHSQTQTTQALQPVSTVSLPPGMVNHAPVSEQVHVAMNRAAKDGIEHITIQLDPAHLGRVEISMHVGADGKAHISFLADKAETFDALSRDARALESSLQEAGIKADAGSMQFNLRQQPQQQMGADLGFGQRGNPRDASDTDETGSDATIGEVSALGAMLSRHYTVNVQDGVDIHA